MEYYELLISILGSTIRLSIPLIFTALAGLFSERAGIFDIGLEGKMLASAFAAACVASVSGSAWAGLGAGIVISVAFGLLHGFASITNRGNQIVSGVAINFLTAGLTIVLGQARRNNIDIAMSLKATMLPAVASAGGVDRRSDMNSKTVKWCCRYVGKAGSDIPALCLYAEGAEVVIKQVLLPSPVTNFYIRAASDAEAACNRRLLIGDHPQKQRDRQEHRESRLEQ